MFGFNVTLCDLVNASKNSLVFEPFAWIINGYLFNSLREIVLLVNFLKLSLTTKQSVICLHFVISISSPYVLSVIFKITISIKPFLNLGIKSAVRYV